VAAVIFHTIQGSEYTADTCRKGFTGKVL